MWVGLRNIVVDCWGWFEEYCVVGLRNILLSIVVDCCGFVCCEFFVWLMSTKIEEEVGWRGMEKVWVVFV